jgi:spore maturation protein CgeB
MASHGFLNNRLFDAVACGARVVSDEVPGLAEVFGDAVAIYRSPRDLAALCDPAHRQRFGSEDVRRARAAAVAADHSFAARARQLMADAAMVEVLPD